MLDDIKLMSIASALTRHSSERHRVISENIANADTRGYKARDVEAFGEAYTRLSNTTRPISPDKSEETFRWRITETQAEGAVSPNGNTVSLEDQVMRSVEAQQNHAAATSIYKKAMDILRTSLRTTS